MSTRFLEHRNGVVTGATGGIGLASARALANAGASVAICARNQTDVDKVARELSEETRSRVVGTAADVSDSGQVSGFFRFVDDALGGLDILVNNPAVATFPTTPNLPLQHS